MGEITNIMEIQRIIILHEKLYVNKLPKLKQNNKFPEILNITRLNQKEVKKNQTKILLVTTLFL